MQILKEWRTGRGSGTSYHPTLRGSIREVGWGQLPGAGRTTETAGNEIERAPMYRPAPSGAVGGHSGRFGELLGAGFQCPRWAMGPFD